MKEILKTVISISLLANLSACGPSKEEIQRKQQAMIDSVTKATEERIAQTLKEQKQEEERLKKIAEEQKQRKRDRAFWSDLLLRTNTELQVQEQKLEDIKTPKLFRTIDEKESQVRQQLLVIEKLQREARRIKDNIEKIDLGEEYIFPSSASVQVRF